MPQLNLKHLRYFWAVAREGSIVGAAGLLHVTPQTISGQLRLLEEQVGSALFRRAGRGLVLTETGRLVLGYADEMFRLGSELEQVLGGRHPTRILVVQSGSKGHLHEIRLTGIREAETSPQPIVPESLAEEARRLMEDEP